MAAPTPPSPSEPKTAGDAKSDAKPEEEQGSETSAVAATAAVAVSPAAAVPLSYAGTKDSEAYSMAKRKLTEGDFEGALETAETALKATLTLVPDADELHESLAPLYYMYGTTLLYSVEESTECAESAVMVQPQQEGGAGGSNDNAEDLQIAWENLDTARTIVSRIAAPTHSYRSSSADSADAGGHDLVLDLAQIYTRLGDLQVANGNYGPALSDFQRSLDVRSKALGMHDRRVADVHYRLGTTSVAMAAEGEKARQRTEAVGAEAGDGDANAGCPVSAAQIAELRERAIAYFLCCGRSLGGVIGKLCGEDPDEIASVLSEGGGVSSGKGEGKAEAVEAALSSVALSSKPPASSIYISSSKALQAIRNKVRDLKPTESCNSDRVLDLRELLDEIQEAIDSAQEDLKCLSDVSSMKAKAEAEAEAEDRSPLQMDREDNCVDNASAKPAAGMTMVGFGACAAVASSSTTTTPMMVVKKKKKRDEGHWESNAKRFKSTSS